MNKLGLYKEILDELVERALEEHPIPNGYTKLMQDTVQDIQDDLECYFCKLERAKR